MKIVIYVVLILSVLAILDCKPPTKKPQDKPTVTRNPSHSTTGKESHQNKLRPSNSSRNPSNKPSKRPNKPSSSHSNKPNRRPHRPSKRPNKKPSGSSWNNLANFTKEVSPTVISSLAQNAPTVINALNGKPATTAANPQNENSESKVQTPETPAEVSETSAEASDKPSVESETPAVASETPATKKNHHGLLSRIKQKIKNYLS